MEETLWKSADKLRGSVESAEYKHVVLSLFFYSLPVINLKNAEGKLLKIIVKTCRYEAFLYKGECILFDGRK